MGRRRLFLRVSSIDGVWVWWFRGSREIGDGRTTQTVTNVVDNVDHDGRWAD